LISASEHSAVDSQGRHPRREKTRIVGACAGQHPTRAARRVERGVEQARPKAPSPAMLMQDQHERVVAGSEIDSHQIVVVALGSRFVSRKHSPSVDQDFDAIVYP
jgi:hypothetical protein